LKKTLNRIAAAVLSVIISLTTLGVSAAAAENNLNFDRGATPTFSDTTTYSVSGRKTITDFFGEITKNLTPGDEPKIVTVKLNNTAPESATFYLIATPLEQEATETLIADGYAFAAGKTAKADLLEQILVEVKHVGTTAGEKVLYEKDSMKGLNSNGYEGNVLPIGTVTGNSHATITIELTIPAEVGNEYQNALAAVDLSFRYVLADPPPSGQPPIVVPPNIPQVNQPENPAQPAPPAPPVNDDEIIEDAPPPLTEYTPPIIDDEETETIDDEEVPLADFEVAPKTGDENPGMLTFATVAAIALVTIIVLLMTGGRKKTKPAA
jgi:hypothetical protein